MTMDERRTRDRMRELANGEWEQMDPLTRRCLGVLADSIDSIHESNRRAIVEIRTENEEFQKGIRQEVADLRKTMVGLLVTILVTVVASNLVPLVR